MMIFYSSGSMNDTKRGGKVLSLFSIVQFPNLECSTGDTTTPFGTCLASSECTSKGGSSTGNCAAGFGVCCVASTSTCGTSISLNTSYIRNPGYPSTYTPTNAGTCVYTINKANDDVCQLRLDFISHSGFVTATGGVCTDKFEAAGQTGKNPPTICGTNTGYHMYVEFGLSSTDTISLTNTFAAGGLATAKTYNILLRQICCNDNWKAPTNCVQYFTGISGSVQSYNHQGSQFLESQDYQNCFRTEKGYCKIQWKESSTTSPDPFGIGPTALMVKAESGVCSTAHFGYFGVPQLSSDGVTAISGAPLGFQSQVCGSVFGIDENTTPSTLISAQLPFVANVFSDTAANGQQNGAGFNMEYTQLAC